MPEISRKAMENNLIYFDMSHEERLEIFNKYKDYAEMLARIAKTGLRDLEAVSCAHRALWRLAGYAKEGVIGKKFLKGQISIELVKESMNLPNNDSALKYIKCKKGTLPANRNKTSRLEEIESLVEHGRHCTIDVVDWNANPYEDKRPAEEAYPFDMPEQIRYIFDKTAEGFSQREIGADFGITQQSIRSKIKDYVDKNKFKFTS